jgi:hypothetical protein
MTMAVTTALGMLRFGSFTSSPAWTITSNPSKAM